MAFEFIEQNLAQQRHLHRYRETICIEAIDQQNIRVNGKNYINFSSNDYLGLNQHPEINQAYQQGVSQFGLCSAGSALVTGYQYPHQQLENVICEWLNMPSCLLFTSGFTANNGVLQALGHESVNYFLDKLSHASLIDGALSSKARTKRFLHNNVEQLDALLNKPVKQSSTTSTAVNNVIVSEGVFSMDGDKAPISALNTIRKKHHALLYLDEAHSIGVLGQQGQGVTNSTEGADMIMATFGKAVATSGAFLACSDKVKEYLLNFNRHYIFSTAMSPAMAVATAKSIAIIQQEQWRRDRIQTLSELFISLLNNEIKVLPTQSSIHALVIGSEEKTLKMSQQLKEAGFWLSAIRPPTVAVGSSRLRVTINANHNAKEIKALAEAIKKVSSSC